MDYILSSSPEVLVPVAAAIHEAAVWPFDHTPVLADFWGASPLHPAAFAGEGGIRLESRRDRNRLHPTLGPILATASLSEDDGGNGKTRGLEGSEASSLDCATSPSCSSQMKLRMDKDWRVRTTSFRSSASISESTQKRSSPKCSDNWTKYVRR